jgi:DNA-binding NarL/FixJ family response regulator
VLSAKTVEKHVGAIMRKTGTTNRTAAVLAALANDW